MTLVSQMTGFFANMTTSRFRLHIPNSVLPWFNAEYDIGGMRFDVVLGDLS